MKAHRRQELKTNTLAEQLAEIFAYLRNQSQAATVAVVAVVVVLGVLWYWHRTVQARRLEGWQAMMTLLSTSRQQDPQVLDKMEQVAASYSDLRFKAMAYAQLGNRLLDEATMAENPEVARDYTARAGAAFQTVVSQMPDQTIPAAIARLGLASMAADKGDFDTAKRYYEAVGNDEQLTGTPFPQEASAGLTALEAARKLPPLAPASQPATPIASASPAARAAASASAPPPPVALALPPGQSVAPAQAVAPASPGGAEASRPAGGNAPTSRPGND
jgi:hypothetical protein